MSVEVSTKELITLIRSGIQGRNQAIEHMYQLKDLRHKIVRYIVKRGGSHAEGEDIYVDALVAFVKNAKVPGFTLKQSLDSYLFGTCRYLWYGKIRKKKNTQQMEPQHDSPEGVDPYKLLLKDDQKKWINLFLSEIDESCKEVLKLWAYHYKMQEIKEIMHYKSEGVARKKKYLCLKKLYQLIAEKKEWADRLREI